METNGFRRCSRCVMDSRADKRILFDERGVCNHCKDAELELRHNYFPNSEGKERLAELLDDIKRRGKHSQYDCLIGVSGGLDSSYLAYLVSQWGLRVLAVHIDDGYDTEISKSNIKKLIDRTGFDYEVIVPDAEQFNDLTLSYIKAGVPNIDTPQDNVLFAFIYHLMRKHNIKYFLSGFNYATECIGGGYDTGSASDLTNLRDIHKRFGAKEINNLSFISTTRRAINKYLLNIKTSHPLNYVDYNTDRALIELNDYCGFEYYGRKHLENALTAFIQLRWYPEKFGIDKRTWHLSSKIITGQITREEAINELNEPMYDDRLMRSYQELIEHNLGITHDQLEEWLRAPGHFYYEYKTEDRNLLVRLMKKINALTKK